MITAQELSTQTGSTIRTIQRHCKAQGLKKTAGVYIMTQKQAQRVTAACQDGPGRPQAKGAPMK